jgi:hypothetical protein
VTARPIPLLAPVTTATLSASRRSMVSVSSRCHVVAPILCAIARCRAGSIIRSAPEMAYQEGRECQATGPEGVTKTENSVGRCWAPRVAASFGLRSYAKSSLKKAGSINDGEAKGAPDQIRCGSTAGGW